jgi:heme iron utilization protein
VRQRRLARHLQHRHRSERHAFLQRGPVGALDAHVVEVDAGQVQRDAAFLAAAAGEVELDVTHELRDAGDPLAQRPECGCRVGSVAGTGSLPTSRLDLKLDAGQNTTQERKTMNPDDARSLRTLLETRPVAALATIHNGEPAASMVPFAILPGGTSLVVHVSRLATHTKDMLAHPGVALLVTASLEPGASPLALPRASVQGHARVCETESAEYAAARAAYLAKLPQAEELFSFGDFSLFLVDIRSVRYVAGFGRAMSVAAPQLAALMSAKR